MTATCGNIQIAGGIFCFAITAGGRRVLLTTQAKEIDTQPSLNKKITKYIGLINKTWAHRARNISVHSHSTRGVRALLCLTKFEKKSSQNEIKEYNVTEKGGIIFSLFSMDLAY